MGAEKSRHHQSSIPGLQPIASERNEDGNSAASELSPLDCEKKYNHLHGLECAQLLTFCCHSALVLCGTVFLSFECSFHRHDAL